MLGVNNKQQTTNNPMTNNKQQTTDYRILVSRSESRPRASWYPFDLQDRIPTFPLPLRSPDSEPIIDLRALLNQVYERAGYGFVLDYSTAPVPSLSKRSQVWMDTMLREVGVRY
ncbi:MAG: DUF4058 family protein [Symploca sp. SIO2E6]|nr:DUF4058 family protein [Symploca sp. SIO2E6]